MTNLTNTFEGITPSGTTITLANSGGASGNAFSAVTTPAASDSTHAMHGSLSAKFAAVGTGCFVQWTGIGSVATLWFRVYLYVTANPAANSRFLSTQTSTGTVCGLGYITTTGKVLMANSAGGTVLTTTNSVNLNAWTRIEGFITGSATVGREEVKLFLTPDSATADETLTSAANLATGGTIDRAAFGPSNAVTYTEWLDDIGTSTTAYLGPSVIQATAAPAGAGTITVIPVIKAPAAPAGAGIQTTVPVISAPATLAGAGTETTVPVIQVPAALGGAGIVTAAATVASGAIQVTATLTGAGTEATVPVISVASALAGAGAASSGITAGAPASLAGAGSAASGVIIGAPAALAGAGIVTLAPRQAAAASLAGSGTGTTVPVISVSSALAGAGSAASGTAASVAAGLAGAGSLTAVPAISVSASLAGTGTVTAVPAISVSASLAGSGSETTVPVIQAPAAPAGSGSETTVPVISVSAALAGDGEITATASAGGGAIQVTATLGGDGATAGVPAIGAGGVLSVPGFAGTVPLIAVAAPLAGTGALAGAVTVFQSTYGAALAGAGTVTGAVRAFIDITVAPGATTARPMLAVRATAGDGKTAGLVGDDGKGAGTPVLARKIAGIIIDRDG